MTRVFFAIMFSVLAVVAQAENETYDQLFQEGTLDSLALDGVLIYRQEVSALAEPDRAQHETGMVKMSAMEDGQVDLRLTKEGQFKSYGRYPKSVGNPLLMVVAETVTRDMANIAGGSPFYIRNRVKNAMITEAEVTTGTAQWNGSEVATKTLVLKPFLNDDNRARMAGWQDLMIKVTTSDDVPGWYVAIEASAEADGNLIYRRALSLEDMK